MKKRNLLLTFLLVFFASLSSLSAEEKLDCTKTAEIGSTITCTFSIGEETRMIETDSEYLKIESVSGNGNTQLNDYQAIYQSSGKIKFIAKKSGTAHVYVSSEDGIFGYDELEQTIKISAKTTTTKKATTTTTTKKKSNNNYLSSITIDDEEIEEFSKDKTKYFINVPYEVTKVTINAKLEDSSATYEINGPKILDVGDNEYTIGVTSEDNTTKFYKIIINRAEEEVPSSTKVSNIKISGYKLNFDGNSKTYHLKVDKDIKKLDIDVELEDENATYEIDGNHDLKDGSVIKINVTTQDDKEDTYRIIVNKEAKSNYLPYLIIGIIVALVIAIIVFILVKKNKKKNDIKEKKVSLNNKTQNTLEYKKDEDLEKTIKIPSLNSDEESIDNDDEEETKVLSYEEKEELEKTKLIDLNNEIDKAFEDTFEK